VAGGTGLGVI
jgi:basic membrane protein A